MFYHGLATKPRLKELVLPKVVLCNTLFPPVCKNNYAGQELWQTQRCECVILNGP
jgi:hypothetical protein